MATFRLVGIYRIHPTAESISAAAKYHGYQFLFDDSGNFTDEIVQENLRDLALVEFQILGQYSPSELNGVSQEGQAPYMEFYLDPSGTQFMQERAAVRTEGRRVCFFLHFVDVSKPITVGSQLMDLPSMAELPDRLRRYTHYVPVD